MTDCEDWVYDWVYCPECLGEEGHVNAEDEWVPCPECDGEGGRAGPWVAP
jgi:hypothetical protein